MKLTIPRPIVVVKPFLKDRQRNHDTPNIASNATSRCASRLLHTNIPAYPKLPEFLRDLNGQMALQKMFGRRLSLHIIHLFKIAGQKHSIKPHVSAMRVAEKSAR